MLVGLTRAAKAAGSRRRRVLSWSIYLCLALLTCDVLHLCSSISPVYATEEDDSLSSSAKSNDYSMANLLPSFKSFLFWRNGNGDSEPKPMDEELTPAEKVTYEVNTDDEMPPMLRPDSGFNFTPSKHWNSQRTKMFSSSTKNNRICHSCAKESFMDVDEEYRQRIEYIKEQILNKLGLSEPPQLHQMPDIDYNMRIAENSISQRDVITTDHDSSEGVERALILPKKRNPKSPEFDLSSVNIDGDKVIKSITVLVKYNLSENYYHTSADETDLVVAAVSPDNDEEESDFGLLSSVNVVKQSTSKVENNFDSGHWIQYNVTNLLADYSGMIRIYNENFDILRSVIMLEMSRHKFIRAKRSLDCTERVSFCCRQPFFVNFTTIGWNNWILFPPGYNANYCRGKYPVIKLCCSPREMSAISLIYMDKQSTIYHKVLDNMVVESCDCA